MEKRALFEKVASHVGARCVLSLVLATLAVPAFARTVTVTSCDRETGATVLRPRDGRDGPRDLGGRGG